MDIFKVLAFTLLALILVISIKEEKKEIALILSLIAGIMILFTALGALDNIIILLKELVSKSGVNARYLEVIIKVTAVAYLIEFGKNVCIDAGQSSLGTKLEMAGKISIVLLTIPIITSVIEIITRLI